MPRVARVVVQDIPHHITQRGNRRQTVFFCDEDKAAYLKFLTKFITHHDVEIWAYCLMDNHIHAIAVPHKTNALAKAFAETHQRYSMMINRRKGWRGYLWQGRFSSCPMDEKHLYAAMRYVENNPVRANMVMHAEDYKWSSARAHVLGTHDEVLSGREREVLSMQDWRSFLREDDDKDVLDQLRKHSQAGRPLGNDEFLDKVEHLTRRILRKNKPGP